MQKLLKKTALVLGAVLALGAVIAVPRVALATETDNDWMSTTAEVRGGTTQPGDTVTIDLQFIAKIAIGGPHLSVLYSPDRPNGTTFTCDNGVPATPEPLPTDTSAVSVPSAAAVGDTTNCEIVAPNSPGNHTLTLVWRDPHLPAAIHQHG